MLKWEKLSFCVAYFLSNDSFISTFLPCFEHRAIIIIILKSSESLCIHKSTAVVANFLSAECSKAKWSNQNYANFRIRPERRFSFLSTRFRFFFLIFLKNSWIFLIFNRIWCFMRTWWGFLIFIYLNFETEKYKRKKDERYSNQELHKLTEKNQVSEMMRIEIKSSTIEAKGWIGLCLICFTLLNYKTILIEINPLMRVREKCAKF